MNSQEINPSKVPSTFSTLKKNVGAYLGEAGDFEEGEGIVFENAGEAELGERSRSEADTETWTIDWRAKIPGNPPKVPVDVEATPTNAGSDSFYESLKGLFNPCRSFNIEVQPPAIIFLNSKVGQLQTMKLRIKNVDGVPRRVKIIPPKNQSFQVSWKRHRPYTTILPGLTIPVLVQYCPSSNLSVNDQLFIAVEGDGGLMVPVVAAIEPQPILEFEEWDCGCSALLVTRTCSFVVKNVGNGGRFWFLTEDEFCHQVIAYPKRLVPSLPSSETKVKEEGKLANRRNSLIKTSKSGEFLITTGPFKINTACFKLMRNQKIKVDIKYMPKTVGLHCEKVAVMCDNGGVRWIPVKGMGIDMKSKELMDLKIPNYWTAQAGNLPYFDPKHLFTSASGDMVRGGVTGQNVGDSGICENPFLYLEESEIFFSKETLESNNVEDCIVTLANPCSIPLTFTWQPFLIGRKSQNISADFCPETGFVPPRGTMDCILSLTANNQKIELRHVYAVCVVDGMRKPLILKISSKL